MLKFVKDVKGYTPKTYREKSEYRVKAPRALRAAAERILQVEKDEWSEAYQTALRVMLEDRLRTSLGTQVKLQGAEAGRGRIVLEFFSRDELDRLCDQLAPKDLL